MIAKGKGNRASLVFTIALAAQILSQRPSAATSFEPSAYPDPRIEIVDKSCPIKLGNASVERLATGFRWAEGTVYFADQKELLFSDIPNNRIMRWLEDNQKLSVFREPSNFTNGNTRDRQGRLLSCEHESRRVTRTEYDGTVSVLTDNYQGKKYNAPNDLVVAKDDSIFFTDPGYGLESPYEGGSNQKSELPHAVYRVEPSTGKAECVIKSLSRPNGIEFSPDGSKLYVSDTDNEGKKATVSVYDYDKGILSAGKTFITVDEGVIDGMRADKSGNLWCTLNGPANENGARCYSPNGTLLLKVHLPEPAGNLCFGGAKNNRLFIAAGQSLYAVYLKTEGK